VISLDSLLVDFQRKIYYRAAFFDVKKIMSGIFATHLVPVICRKSVEN
jgi:hypothetical protein